MSLTQNTSPRRMPIGAELLGKGEVSFRVWAPDSKKVVVVLEGGTGRVTSSRHELSPENNGYFSRIVAGISSRTLYRFLLDEEEELLPDPASRFQPQGPFGPSEIVDPGEFRWTDAAWKGIGIEGQVIYEMHIGTFTPEGTWEGARQQLASLAETGITLLEVMPVADFPGKFGWGYDGVNLFAPTRLYGTPDDMRRFVDSAHSLGLGVLLDVVYNHVGSFGSHLHKYAKSYFHQARQTDWGEAINYDGQDSGPVREYFISNAAYWIEEFHLDGLRLDAAQTIYDTSPEHIIAAICRRARNAAGKRHVIVAAENEPQDVKLIATVEKGGYGCDAIWNDDFHHTATVTLTGRREAYYMDYLGNPQELISCIKRGYLYQGQRYNWQRKRRGTAALNIRPARFIHFLQNHDQIANSACGLRYQYLTSPGRYRAMTALLLLSPETPLLFQGQEFAASSPFVFFSDMPGEIAALVRQGRNKFLSQFPSLADPDMLSRIPDPGDISSFCRCKLDLSERGKHAKDHAFYRDLLRLRREDPVFRSQRQGDVDGAVIGPQAFLLRYFGQNGDDRLVVFNFGRDLELWHVPEPLLAPPENARWNLVWSSESPVYGGSGALSPEDGEGNWRIMGETASVLKGVKGTAQA
ncbi:MAG: malto-oligosyltrehalose trehalohydrolase [Chloroflexi bacterium]|nr:malto-oligosyltrehalose trehalohydrolase [Chloroflexota bacterium]